MEYTECRGFPAVIRVNLTVGWAVETAAIQTKPACAGSKVLIFRQSVQADFVFVAAISNR